MQAEKPDLLISVETCISLHKFGCSSGVIPEVLQLAGVSLSLLIFKRARHFVRGMLRFQLGGGKLYKVDACKFIIEETQPKHWRWCAPGTTATDSPVLGPCWELSKLGIVNV